jgi:hypothetical protein
MWYIYEIEFTSTTVNQDFMSFARKWMEVEIMLSDI